MDVEHNLFSFFASFVAKATESISQCPHVEVGGCGIGLSLLPLLTTLPLKPGMCPVGL